VYSLQKDLIHWTTQALQKLVPDRSNLSAEAKEAELLHTAFVEELIGKSERIVVNLSAFTSNVVKCCAEFVAHETQLKRDGHDENAEHEQRELIRFETECKKWIEINKNLQTELRGVTTTVDKRIKSARSERRTKIDLSEKNFDLNEKETDKTIQEFESEIDEQSQILLNKESTAILDSLLSATERTDDLHELGKRRASTHIKGDKTKASKSVHRKKGHGKPDKKGIHISDIKDNGHTKSVQDQVGPEEDHPHNDQTFKSEFEEIASASSATHETIRVDEKFQNAGHDLQLTDEEDERETMEILGYDSSTRTVPLDSTGFSSIGLEDGANQSVLAVEFLQQQLIQAERRAQLAQERISVVETELAEALQKMRSIERSSAIRTPSNEEGVVHIIHEVRRTTPTPATRTKSNLNVPETGRRTSITTASGKDRDHKDHHRVGSSRGRNHEDKTK